MATRDDNDDPTKGRSENRTKGHGGGGRGRDDAPRKPIGKTADNTGIGKVPAPKGASRRASDFLTGKGAEYRGNPLDKNRAKADALLRRARQK